MEFSENCCRICLVSCSVADLEAREFTEKIEKCSGVRIEEDLEPSPRKICGICVSRLLIVEKFLTTIESSQKILENRPILRLPEDHKSNYEGVLSCEFCDEFSCVASETEILQEHIQERHPEKLTVPEVRFRCLTCEKEHSNEKSLKRHIENVHNKTRYFCEKCGKSYSIWDNLVSHFNKAHLGKYSTYKCRFCEKEYRNWGSRYYHEIQAHTKAFKHVCEVCQKTFLHKTQLEDHVAAIHTGVKHRPCTEEGCGMSFSSRESLNWHRKSSHGQLKKLQCLHCHKEFLRKKHLVRHEKVHFQDSLE